MANRQVRFTILQLLLVTMFIAVFCVVLMNENEWLRATFVTCAMACELNAMIAAIFARGERRAFALAFVVGSFAFALFSYAGYFTLPYLITDKLYNLIKASSSSPPDDDHFFIVMIVFWALLTATSSAFIGTAWYRRAQSAESPSGSNEASPGKASPEPYAETR